MTSNTQLPRRLLGIWAHPDDEAYLSAGLMGRVVDAGGHVTSVAVTLGELGFPDDEPCTFDERAAHRFGELTRALGTVGVKDVRSLGFADGALEDTPMGLMVDAIAAVIDEVRPDVIVTFGPDGITGHPDHIETGRAVTIAAAGRPEVELLYATHSAEFLDEWRELHNELGVYMGAEPDGTRPEDHVLHVELDGAELDRKRASLAAHASQTAMLSSIMGEATYREWIRAETFRAPTPADFALQPA